MFKKLQNLLFEDEEVDEEEDIDEEDEEEEEKPKKRKKAKRPEPEEEEEEEPVKPAVQPVQQMHRIDVTQAIPKAEPVKPVQAAPLYANNTVQHASPRPIQADDVKTPELPKQTFGISVDTPKAAAPVKKAEPAKEKKPRKATYEFKPVISPMFGVDEKDIDAMQTSAKNAFLSDDKDDENVSKIISPIYGVSQDAKPTPIAATVEKSNEMEEMTFNKEARKSEDELPDFSLDDILNARDEEFAREAASAAAPKEGEDIDETVVFDSKHLQPFGKIDSAKEQDKK